MATRVRLFLSLMFALCLAIVVPAQTRPIPKKLPTVDKIVDNYLKAIGGKKKIAEIRDTTYDWTILVKERAFGTARAKVKPPFSERWEMVFENGLVVSGTSSTSAWEIGLDNKLRTLTGLESANAKLRSLLASTRLLNYKKLNVLARVVSLGDLGSEPAYIVEFSTKSGAKVQYYFSVQTSLITRITDDVRKGRVRFDEYKAKNGILEPHRIRIDSGGADDYTLVLQSVSYNTGIEDKQFDPPRAAENLDVEALMKEVGKNQDEVERRFDEYAFTQTETDREINNKGELKKQTVKVYEVYPVPNRDAVRKLISENGVPLTPEKRAKEDKRVQEELIKADRDKEKDKAEADKRKAEQARKNKAAGREEDDDPEISQFLKACVFVSPRRETFADREVIVFDFRPRPGFKPTSRGDSLIAKLVGTIWVDPVDKQVIRLEARLAEGFKMAGGLLVSLKPGAALVSEQTRMADGTWLPKFAQINLSVKVFVFGGGDYNKTVEWSNYKHFSGNVNDYKIESPKP